MQSISQKEIATQTSSSCGDFSAITLDRDTSASSRSPGGYVGLRLSELDMPAGEKYTPSRNVIFGIGFYALCSSSMLFFNKLSVSDEHVQQYKLLPGPISCIQLGFANLFCLFLWASGIEKFDDIRNAHTIKMYTIYSLLFVGSVYASMKALQGSNMETQIVFRSATPIAVACLEAGFLGRELPSKQSALALAAILASALFYVANDSEFAMNGFAAYTWISVYFVLICVSMTLGKHLMSSTKTTVWSSVLLTNGLSFPMLFLLSLLRGEMEHFSDAALETSASQWGIILAGCATGTMIGWAGWYCRDLVSATSYTLIGVANKMLTVLLGVFFLDKHASPLGIASLVACIAASTQYKQAPLRHSKGDDKGGAGGNPVNASSQKLDEENGDKPGDKEKQRATP